MTVSINNNTKKIEFEGLSKFKYLDIIKTKEILEHIAKHENKSEYEGDCLDNTLALLNDLIQDYYGE